MRRTWIGAGVMALILTAGLWVMQGTQRALMPVAEQLSLARHAVEEDNWNDAVLAMEKGRVQWTEQWKFCAAVLDQETMEQIDGAFAELDACCAMQNRDDFGTRCAQTAELLRGTVEESKPSWWNLL